VGDSELVRPSTFEQAVAAETDIDKSGNRAGTPVGQGHLAENAPAVVLGSLDDVLSKRITGRPGACLWLDRVDRRSGNNDLPDSIERGVFFGSYGAAKRMLACLA